MIRRVEYEIATYKRTGFNEEYYDMQDYPHLRLMSSENRDFVEVDFGGQRCIVKLKELYAVVANMRDVYDREE